MSDGTAVDPPQGTPGRRALGAMEIAVRRARERTGATTLTTPAAEKSTPVAGTPSTFPPPPLGPRPWRSAGPMPPRPEPPGPHQRERWLAQREHWLAVSVAVVAVLLVAGGIALAVSSGTSGPPVAAPPPSAPAGTAHNANPAAPRPVGHHGSSQVSPRGSTTTSVPAPPASTGGPPVISSISPTSGPAGQGIQIAGANFLSSDGQIVATFNGQVAPTSCPAENTCTVTVPQMAGTPSAQVTITTAGGTSNAVTFTYS